MEWLARVVASGRRLSAERAYLQARLNVARLDHAQPASWWGLCALLSHHQLRHGSIRPMSDLWSELLPFLLMRNEVVAERAVEEYLLYKVDPRPVDKQWLGVKINEAMERVDTWDDSIGAVLQHPERAFRARWMALLSYQTLLRLRRAVALYSSEFAQSHRPSYWHGLPALDEDVFPAVRPGARMPCWIDGGGALHRRFRLNDRPTPTACRRFRPLIPPSSSLS